MSKYSKADRLEIGHKIYESGMTFIETGLVYGFSAETQLFYEQYSGVEHRSGNKPVPKPSIEVEANSAEPLQSNVDYESMTKEQLIQ